MVDATPSDLEGLLVRALEHHSNGDSVAVDELCAAHPEHAAALREHLRELRLSGLLDGEGAPAILALGEWLGGHRLLYRLGEGGMGVVYVAEDRSLGRRVALKVLRPDLAHSRQARARFQREVQTIARLAHPSIVPLFREGEERGVAYFTMALVEGASLAEVLRELEGRDPAELQGRDLFKALVRLTEARGFDVTGASPDEPLFAGPWAQAMAWLAREVAQALEHAHQREVLHRDVKPSNILLTPAGHVLLVDFGLASLTGNERMTRTGSQLGSLPYMAPEQIAGDPGRVDARVDVYGLGVLFYELLALRLPFQESDPARLSIRVASGDKPSLRSFHRGLPADYETVCFTALDADPARRYASAAHLARDLSNLLERRPIEARPAGLGVLLTRWSERHPGRAVGLAAGLLLLVFGPLVYGRLEANAGLRVSRERDVAEQNLDAALEAVEVLLERVGSRELRDVPRVARLRAELLERAASLYARLESSSRGDLRTRLRIASALGKLAKLRQESGEREAALVGFDEAERRLEALAQEAPSDPDVLFEYGNLLAFAAVSRFPGDPSAALPALEPALAALRRARAVAPTAIRPRSELARGLVARGHFAFNADELEVALAAFAEADELSTGLLAECEPGTPAAIDALELQLTARLRSAGALQAQGEKERAAELLEAGLVICATVADPSSYLRQLRSAAIMTLVQIRGESEGDERSSELDRLLDVAHADALALTHDFPNNEQFATSAANSFAALGARALRFQNWEMAREHSLEAARLERELQRRHAENPRHSGNLGLALGRVAEAELALERPEEFDRQTWLAIEAHRECLARGGNDVHKRNILDRLRSYATWAHMTQDAEGLDRVTDGLLEWLDGTFMATVDAARCAMLAGDIWRAEGDVAASDERRATAVRCLERALAIDPRQTKIVSDFARSLGLDQEPRILELLKR